LCEPLKSGEPLKTGSMVAAPAQCRRFCFTPDQRPTASRQPDTEPPAGRELQQSSVSERVLPSIVPDEFADNHAVELDACKR